MNLSVLIAFRDSEDGHRGRLWSFLEKQYARWLPGAEVIVESDDGEDPFHKTLALNRAAAKATRDLILIGDADTWVPHNQVLRAVQLITENEKMWGRPWNQKVKLGQDDTEELLGLTSWDEGLKPLWERHGRLENRNTYWAAPPTLVTREQFFRAGGMDERFRGWGKEDEAFCLTLRSLVGKPQQVRGYSIHLWHPRIGKSGNDHWEGETDHRDRNNALVRAYDKASRYPDRMAELVASREEM